MASSATMAMSSDFLEAYARLPRPQQRGVRSLISKFNVDSTASGLNDERIHGARDPNMRSLRIDLGYRAIVLKPDRGNVHMLLWAAKHDDAYHWAERHECRINAETGALQIFEPQPGSPADLAAPSTDATAAAADGPSAFEGLRDRQLARLGVPAAMLPEVRAVRDDVQLDAMQARLPVEAYEALFLYLAGESYETLVREREAASEPVDTTDFEKALNRTDSQARFVVVDDEVELEAMLNAPLERWRVFLHPSQRRLVERNWNGRGEGAGRCRHGEDGRRHAPRALARPQQPGRRSHPVHDVHEEPGRRHREQPAVHLLAGGDGAHRSDEPGPLGGRLPARSSLRVHSHLRATSGSLAVGSRSEARRPRIRERLLPRRVGAGRGCQRRHHRGRVPARVPRRSRHAPASVGAGQGVARVRGVSRSTRGAGPEGDRRRVPGRRCAPGRRPVGAELRDGHRRRSAGHGDAGVPPHPKHGSAGCRRPVHRRRRSPAHLRPEPGRARALRHRDSRSRPEATAQLPHDAADVELGDRPACRLQHRRSGRRPRRQQRDQVLDTRTGTASAGVRDPGRTVRCSCGVA